MWRWAPPKLTKLTELLTVVVSLHWSSVERCIMKLCIALAFPTVYTQT